MAKSKSKSAPAATKTQKEKGPKPTFRECLHYYVGIKGMDFYASHNLDSKNPTLRTAPRAGASGLTKTQAHKIIAELKVRWPDYVYTIFKFSPFIR